MTRSWRNQPTMNASARLRRARRKNGSATAAGVARDNRLESDLAAIEESVDSERCITCHLNCPLGECHLEQD